MSALDIVRLQVHRQATLQPRMALPAGRLVSFEEGYRLAKLYHAEENRIDEAEETFSKTTHSSVNLEEGMSKKIVLLRQKQNKKANVQAAISYGHRQKQRNRVVSSADTEKVLQVAQKVHGKGHDVSEAHGRRLRAAQKSKKSSKKK